MTRAAGRSAALRKADEVIARRAAQIRQRENTLRDALTEYFYARNSADGVHADAEKAATRVRRDAEDRIAQVQERAERQAAGFEQQAQAAVRRMLELGESRQAIAQAAGLTLAQVRDAQRVAPPLADVTDLRSGDSAA